MSVPKFDGMFNAVLIAIKQLGGSASVEELNDKVAQLMQISDEDLAVPHGNRMSEVYYRLTWTRTYLHSFGVIEPGVGRGVWAITAKGQECDSIDPREVVAFVRRQKRSSKRTKHNADAGVIGFTPSQETEIRIVNDAFTDDETSWQEAWRDVLMSQLKALQPASFERLCQRLLREAGFVEVSVTGRTGDGGIDGVGLMRIGGFLSFPVLFQCKRYQASVGADVVRDFRGAMVGRSDRGLIITTGTFTPAARKEATRDGAPPVDLVDGEQLLDKLKDLGLGVSIRQVEEVTVTPGFFKGI